MSSPCGKLKITDIPFTQRRWCRSGRGASTPELAEPGSLQSSPPAESNSSAKGRDASSPSRPCWHDAKAPPLLVTGGRTMTDWSGADGGNVGGDDALEFRRLLQTLLVKHRLRVAAERRLAHRTRLRTCEGPIINILHAGKVQQSQGKVHRPLENSLKSSELEIAQLRHRRWLSLAGQSRRPPLKPQDDIAMKHPRRSLRVGRRSRPARKPRPRIPAHRRASRPRARNRCRPGGMQF